MTFELFEQQFGLTGIERVTTSTPLVAVEGVVYGMIVPQGPASCVIDEITVIEGFTNSDFDSSPMTQSRCIPFTALSLTSGEADVYRLARNRVDKDGNVQKRQ